MARPQVADGGTPPIWRVAAKISNKQSRIAEKGWSSSLGVGRGANSSSSWKLTLCYETFNIASDLDWYFGTTGL